MKLRGYTGFTVCTSIRPSVRSITLLPLVWSFDTWYGYLPLREDVFDIMTFDIDPYLQGHLLMSLAENEKWNHVHGITFHPKKGSFSYLLQIYTTKRMYVLYNDFWSQPISSRSSAHHFAIPITWIVDICRYTLDKKFCWLMFPIRLIWAMR